MKYDEVAPPEHLRNIVRYFWVIDHNGESGQDVPFRLFAESCPGLVFFCRSGYAAVSGLSTDPKSFSIGGSFRMIGAYLYPHTLPSLFNIPANQFFNQQVRLGDIDPVGSRELSDQVLNADSSKHQIDFITNYLLKRLKNSSPDKQMIAAITEMVTTQGATTVDSIASKLNLSSRQLERKFANTIGVPPKLMARLIRFQYSLRLADRDPSLTGIALQAGYFDQSHFIREFTSFAGISPKAYFRLTSGNRADNFVQL